MTLVAAIAWGEAIAPMVLDGPMDGLAFTADVEQVFDSRSPGRGHHRHGQPSPA